ncbi:Rne/Rng family ribonuclease [Plantactinospora sp. GCM10030261]|uniref:Rne/Rng family ribonuclease n=1 Tax=Plantactinospora sp. GCM10030261 TaxID=3273420 RepID=UPI0036116376
MLENEPEGGNRSGEQPAETADTTNSASGVPDTGGTGGTPEAGAVAPDAPAAPARRARATRRRTAAQATEPAQVEAPVEAPATASTTSGEAPDPEVLAPVAGEVEPIAAPARRRRKATSSKSRTTTEPTTDPGAPAGPGATDQAPESAPPAATAGSPGGEAAPEAAPAAEPQAAPVKATRSRRRKAAPAVEPAAVPEPSVDGTDQPAEPAGGVAGEPAGQTAPGSIGDSGAAGEPAGEPVAEPSKATRRRRSALSAPTVLFMAPEPDPKAPPAAVAAAPTVEPVESVPTEPAESAEAGRRRRRGRRGAEAPEPVADEPEEPTETAAEADQDEDEDDETAAGRRRRRRGRRGRGRGKGGADEADGEDEEPAQADAGTEDDEDEEPEGGEALTRRRRRRRRKGAGDTDGGTDDGVPTVVKIREPRKAVDEVQGVSGSTRLEAKRQRRRDGREQRRTRPPILSESEFLARREAVDRMMVVRQRGDRTQVAVLEDGVLVEHYVSRSSSGTMAGNVYLGKVQNVLPSMEAAFVDIGRGRNAVLYAGEVNWDTTGLEGRARSIEQALKSGDSVLVQVTKDPIGHKGARLTSHIALSGRHLVYVPHGNASGISRKLPDTERKRLRDVLKKLVPDGAGVIVRTAAEGASEDELARDVKRLQAQWEEIQAKAAEGGAPVPLSEEPDLVIRVVRDLFNEDFRELVVQGDEAYGMVESYLGHVSPDLVARLRRHTGTADIFAERRIDEQILKGLDRKVFLPSGGHLVIDRTEAMTVIDVNTGKYTGAGGNLEETVTRNNLEAAEEIVRQLRLRDIGGIIVIDFIDMVLESNRELVLRRLTECLGRDRTKHQVTEITSLGLVQMTRKRIGAGLLEAFSETCDCCKGRGLVIHTEPIPEKNRSAGAGDKVKAVASAGNTTETTGGRRRGRRAAAAEPVVETVSASEGARVATEVEVVEEDDTMGYDLSRYENDMPSAPAVEDAREAEPMRLASVDDPDAMDESGEEQNDGGAPGRRRSRRGNTRRRTRP